MSDNFARFTKCAVEVLDVEDDAITKDASFADDLDADSLDLVELVMALEEEFDVSVDEEELEGITTVGAAFDLIEGKLKPQKFAYPFRLAAGKLKLEGDKSIRLLDLRTAEDAQPQVVSKECSITDRKSTRLNSSHSQQSRMPSSA